MDNEKGSDYLDEFLQRERDAIKSRQGVSKFILHLGCQSLSCSLTILLFQFAVDVWLISLLCYLIALAPFVGSLSTMRVDNEHWRITIVRKGLPALVGLAITVAFTHIKLMDVYVQLAQTDVGINRFLQDVRAYEHPTEHQYQLPSQGIILVASIVIVFVLGYVLEKKGK